MPLSLLIFALILLLLLISLCFRFRLRAAAIFALRHYCRHFLRHSPLLSLSIRDSAAISAMLISTPAAYAISLYAIIHYAFHSAIDADIDADDAFAMPPYAA